MNRKGLVLVTGASTGIGREISRKLCHENYEVILASRSTGKLQKLEKEFSKNGYLFHLIKCDISIEKDVKNLYRKSTEIGFVSCIINNAGIGKFSSIDKISVKDWDDQININLRGSFLVTRFFIKSMIKNKMGKLIFINSVAGKYGHSYPSSTAYVTSKYGLRGFSKSLRTDLRQHNIKVISIYPGAVDTNFWDTTNVDFPREEMLSAKDISETIFHSIVAPNSSVLEEIVIRRTGGDF